MVFHEHTGIHTPQHIHFIGICGVAMSAIAIAFHKKGWKVTGSDVGFYPPISTHLKEEGVEYYPGWHVENMTKYGNPDIVVVGNVASSTNPEWEYVQEKHIPYKSYPEIIAEYFLRDHSIVCAGTYGKTTTSALLSHILVEADKHPSYMFGGLTQNNTMPSACIDQGQYSVVEGDEYKTARWDSRPKFKLYSPTHVLLTAVSWDHADIYPTEQHYFNEFYDLVNAVPNTGYIVANTDQPGVTQVLKQRTSTARLISYGTKDQEYTYSNLTQTTQGISFTITHKQTAYAIQSPMIGAYMAENITGAFALANTIGISTETSIQSIASFTGMKRRLEKRLDNNITVIDDIAHSPEKAASVLQTLRTVYTGNIIAVFEPNGGNRQKEAIPQYAQAFNAATTVFIPRLTTIKTNPHDPNPPMDGNTLAHIVAKTHPDVHYIEEDDVLVQKILKKVHPGDVLVFLGSHGFRGMIEDMLNAYKK